MAGDISGFWWALLAVGFVGGIASGTFGVGSGIIFIPALVLLFPMSQHSAQGTALAVMVPMALLGAFRYWKSPDIDINLGLVALLVAGSLGGVLIGTEIAQRVDGHWLRKGFAVFMVIVAMRMFFMPPKKTDSSEGPGDSQAAITLIETSETND